MKPKIKKTKQPDVLEYDGDGFEIKTVDSLTKKGFYLMIRIPNVREIYLPIPQAKELSKVLPKFLEEMERETK